MNKFWINILLLSSLLLYACDISKNKEVKPEEVFVKIYENNQFDRSFTPLDIKQTPDGGYLILGEYTGSAFSPYPAVYLMKTQADGRFEWEYLAQDNYVTPISELLPTADGSSYEFFCSAQTDSLKPVRLSAVQTPEQLAKYNIIRTLTANKLADGNYGFVAYSQNSQYTTVAKGNASGGVLNSKQYYNQDNTFIEERIDRHLRRIRTPLPMLMGSRGGNDLFFTAFRLSNITVMSDDLSANGSEPKGIINGNSYDAAISAMVNISGNTFAMARYNADGENVFITRAEVAPNGTYTNTSFKGNILPELSKFARVIIKKATIAQRNVLLYFTDTKNGQMVLFIYDETTGALIKTRYFGSSNTFQAGNLTLTLDGGLAVVGKTYVAGRFGRICLFKLTAKELEALVKP